MDCGRLYVNVVLCPQKPDDLADAIRILQGKVSVAEVAEKRAQDCHSFDAGADGLILSYTARDEQTLYEKEAKRVLGQDINKVFIEQIIPALAESQVPLEFVVRYCNLSLESVILLSEAIQANRHLVGFNIFGNPGNTEIGETSLKYACVRTLAPIQWFQGAIIEEEIRVLKEGYAIDPADDEAPEDDEYRNRTRRPVEDTSGAPKSILLRRATPAIRINPPNRKPGDSFHDHGAGRRRRATEPYMRNVDNQIQVERPFYTWRTPPMILYERTNHKA